MSLGDLIVGLGLPLVLATAVVAVGLSGGMLSHGRKDRIERSAMGAIIVLAAGVAIWAWVSAYSDLQPKLSFGEMLLTVSVCGIGVLSLRARRRADRTNNRVAGSHE